MAIRKAVEEVAPRLPKPCCYGGCQSEAILRYQTRTGWADMCKGHYLAYTLAECKEYTSGIGVRTQLEMRPFWQARMNVGRKGRMHGAFLANYKGSKPLIDRQPGQDDEEAAA